ncbi:MAG TPA: outer membrane beta-barrel protein [Xanthobacteraceae bacterium]|jgi:opacity protein-like surface antigen|nr:outer membrane beta-barrel protein [Xanthobacteraceae bacterium]
MRRIAMMALAGIASATFCGGASAADMPLKAPPACVPRSQAAMMPNVPICAEEEFGGWYLRGDIGMSNQKVSHLDNALYAGNTIEHHGVGFDSAPFFGLGVGYRVNNWLRFDVTGEYRGKANFHGVDIVNATFDDQYHASKSEWTFLANAYFDLGTWYCITPFVGGGVGFSHNTISGFTDISTINNSVAFGDTASKNSFAWALYAGLAYKVTPGFTVELAYRYLNLGDAQSGDLITYNGSNTVYNPMLFKDLTSQDVKLGVRWDLDTGGSAPIYAPLMTRG